MYVVGTEIVVFDLHRTDVTTLRPEEFAPSSRCLILYWKRRILFDQLQDGRQAAGH